MTTPCYYCDYGISSCKSCIHSDTYEEPKPAKQLNDEEIEAIMYKCDWSYDPVSFARAIIKEITE